MSNLRLSCIKNAGLIIIILICLTPILVASSTSTVNRINDASMAYTAFLAGSDGKPVADGSYNFVFKLKVNSGDLGHVWTESQSILVEDGIVSVTLGEVNSLNATVMDSANFLEVTINGEVLSPSTKLSSTPSAFISDVSRTLKGDVVTEGSSLFIPGTDPVTLPKSVELSKDSHGGRLGIWGTGGTTNPKAELLVEDGRGMFNLYPGHEWISGPDTAMRMSVNSDGGQFGIWGTDGTSTPQVELKGSSTGGQLGVWGASGSTVSGVEIVIDNGSGMLNMYPGNDWISGPDTAMRMSINSDGGNFGIWGTDGTTIPQVELKGSSTGGKLGVWGASGSTASGVEIVIDNGSGMLNMYPGNDWISGPDTAMQMSINSDGGQFGIWGTDGTTSPQVELKGSSSGGQLGIWGNSGTHLSGIEMSVDLQGGLLNMYPGHEWISGPDTAMRMSVKSDGGNLGIWGTNGTSSPQVELKGSSTGGQLGIWGTNGTSFPQLNLSASANGGFLQLNGVAGSDQERVEIRSSDGVGSLSLWGAGGATFPRLKLYGGSGGGSLTLRAVNNDATIYFDGSALGDASVVIPDNAINDSEILNEPGLAQGHSNSCNTLDGTTMENLATVSITIPTDGYIFLTGNGMVEFSGTTNLNRANFQIDESTGGSTVNGYFSRVGLANYVGTSYSSFDYTVTRTYFKSAGTYTFILEGSRVSTSGSASACFPTLTAIFIPTSYGTVIAASVDNSGNQPSVVGESVAQSLDVSEQSVDLRELEIRARATRKAADKAEMELRQAQSKQ